MTGAVALAAVTNLPHGASAKCSPPQMYIWLVLTLQFTSNVTVLRCNLSQDSAMEAAGNLE